MGQYTLNKFEKRLVDNFIVKAVDSGSTNKFTVQLFNHAVCTTLHPARAEELLNGQNTKTIAYIDYVKDFYRIRYK
jgi:hypothetical protein